MAARRLCDRGVDGRCPRPSPDPGRSRPARSPPGPSWATSPAVSVPDASGATGPGAAGSGGAARSTAGRCTPSRQQSPPAWRASPRARSAARSSRAAWPPSRGSSAMPIAALRPLPPAGRRGAGPAGDQSSSWWRRTAQQSRSATCTAPSAPVSGRRIRNSSPPYRPRVSERRISMLSRWTRSRRMALPRPRPCSATIASNPAISSISSASGRRWPSVCSARRERSISLSRVSWRCR